MATLSSNTFRIIIKKESDSIQNLEKMDLEAFKNLG